ncbi:MAG: phytoene desaturase [Anaerolineaceae bacterium]|nr:phytoene desaturase [Anaerolineaceae bacterium]
MKENIAIIGAGVGGLAAGINLCKAGYQVTIYEKNNWPGGKIGGRTIEGFHVDTGPTIIRAPYLFMELFRSASEDPELLELLPVNPQYKFFLPDKRSFEIFLNASETIESLQNISPVDAENYSKYLEHTQKHYRSALGIKPSVSPQQTITQRGKNAASSMISRTLFRFTSTYFSNSFIQSAFSFYPLFFGQSPFISPERISMLHAIEQQWGISYPKEGMLSLAENLATLFERLGGRLIFNTAIRGLQAKRNQITALRLKSGKLEQCDYALSNLSPFGLKKQLTHAKSNPTGTNRNTGCSFFTMNLIIEPHTSHNQLEKHNIFLPTDFERTMSDIFRAKILPRSPWVYLCVTKRNENETQDDPYDNFFIIVPVPNLSSEIDWRKESLSFRNTLLTSLERFLPDLRKRIRHEMVSTPQDFKDTYNLEFGTPLQPAVQTSYKNLFYVGENSWQGLGLIGALTAAEEAVKSIKGFK